MITFLTSVRKKDQKEAFPQFSGNGPNTRFCDQAPFVNAEINLGVCMRACVCAHASMYMYIKE